MAIQGKMLSLFREMSIGKINNCYCQIFPHTDFLIKPFLILLKPTRSINKRVGWHITKEREKTHKKWPNLIFEFIFSLIFYKKTYPGPCLWLILFREFRKLTDEVQTSTHRMQRAFLQVDKWINYANLTVWLL